MVVHGAGPPSGPVLVGVDGSAISLQAVRWAAAEADRRHARLEVLHVVEEPPAGEAGGRGPDRAEGADGAAAARAVLDAAVAVTPDPGAVRARLVTGDPAAMLLRAASRAQLLVLGPRGAGGRMGAQLGSVTWAVLHAGTRSTVLVHGGAAGVRGASGTVRWAAR
jgi:nucleotide-binding universal stress UspA family protein